MARAHFVKSSRTVHRCHAGHDIEPPAAYYWAAPGFRSRKKFACTSHPFRQSQLTTSAVADVYAAQEALEDELDGLTTHEEFQAAWDTFSESVTDFRDMRQEALDAWENGNSQLEELLEQAEEAASEAEAFEVPEFDGDEETAAKEPDDEPEDEPEEPDREDYDDDEDYDTDHEAWEEAHTSWENERAEYDDAVAQHEAWETWVDETREAIRDAISTVVDPL